MKSPERCPVCGDAPQIRVARPDLRVVRSPGCGLEWQSPFPSDAELAALYDDDYFKRWGVGDETSLERVRAMKAASYRPFLRALREVRPGGRLLDVGCAFGFLLDVAAELDFEPYGLDLSPAAVARARRAHGARVHAGGLDRDAFPGVRFDAITLVDVLEHVPDPADFLARVRERLAPGGALACVLPNVASVVRRVLGARWPHYAREHLWYWTPGGLRRFFATRGFEVVALRTGVRKTYTGTYLHAYASCLGGGFAPLFRLLGPARLRVPTGEMWVIARAWDPEGGPGAGAAI